MSESSIHLRFLRGTLGEVNKKRRKRQAGGEPKCNVCALKMESMWIFDFQLRNLYPYCDRCIQGRRTGKMGGLVSRPSGWTSSVEVEGLRGGTLLAVTANQRASKQGIRGGDFGCAP